MSANRRYPSALIVVALITVIVGFSLWKVFLGPPAVSEEWNYRVWQDQLPAVSALAFDGEGGIYAALELTKERGKLLHLAEGKEPVQLLAGMNKPDGIVRLKDALYITSEVSDSAIVKYARGKSTRITGTSSAEEIAIAAENALLVILFLVAWGGRGTLRSGPPLRWGDAFHSPHLFANHLSLNGTYTLVKAAAKSSRQEIGKHWLKSMQTQQAKEILRTLLLTPDDELLADEQFPVLRRHTPSSRLPVPPKMWCL